MPQPKGRRRRSAAAAAAGGAAAVGGHDVELDFEKTVDAIAGLERALDPLLHSVVLLRGEKEREERALEREYAALRRLEVNARAQVRGWREGRGKGREHVLAGGLGVGGGREDGAGEREFEVIPRGGGGAPTIFKVSCASFGYLLWTCFVLTWCGRICKRMSCWRCLSR